MRELKAGEESGEALALGEMLDREHPVIGAMPHPDADHRYLFFHTIVFDEDDWPRRDPERV